MKIILIAILLPTITLASGYHTPHIYYDRGYSDEYRQIQSESLLNRPRPVYPQPSIDDVDSADYSIRNQIYRENLRDNRMRGMPFK